MRFEKYIFICTNERAEDHPRGSCSRRGSLALIDEFKNQLKEHKMLSKIRVNKTGCMECCELGPTVMVHPDNVWYQKVKTEDIKEIIESHILNNIPVERLKMDFSFWAKKTE